jgi:hypothetical protein
MIAGTSIFDEGTPFQAETKLDVVKRPQRKYSKLK